MIYIPVSIKNPIIITQGYHDKHKSIDIKNIDFNGDGLPVYAICDCIVIRIALSDSGANYIYTYDTINNNFITYVHTSVFDEINLGDFIEAGTPIGISDNSGKSTAPHLHLSIWDNEGLRVNPLKLFELAGIKWEFSYLIDEELKGEY